SPETSVAKSDEPHLRLSKPQDERRRKENRGGDRGSGGSRRLRGESGRRPESPEKQDQACPIDQKENGYPEEGFPQVKELRPGHRASEGDKQAVEDRVGVPYQEISVVQAGELDGH